MTNQLLFKLFSSLSALSRIRLFAVLILTLLAALFDLIYILVPSFLFSRFTLVSQSTHKIPFLPLSSLSSLVLVFLLALTLATLFRLFCISFIARSSVRISHEITISLFKYLLSSDYTHFLSFSNSTLKNIFLSQTGQLTSGIINPSLQSFSVLVTIVIVVAFFFLENPHVAVPLFTGATLVYLLAFFFSRRIVSRLGTVSRLSSNSILATLSDVFVGFRQIYINSHQNYFINRYSGLNLSLRNAEASSYIAVSAPRFIIEYTIIVSISLIFVVFLSGNNDPFPLITESVTYFFAAQRVLPLLQSFFSSVTLVSYAKSSISDYAHLLRFCLSKPLVNGVSQLSTFKFIETDSPLLFDVKISSFTYPQSSSSIFTGHFSFYNDSVVLISGPSGSGKSTLIDILTGLIQSPKISFTVNHSNISTSPDKWPTLFSISPQHPVFFEDTVYNNISFPLPSTNSIKLIQKSLLAAGFSAEEFSSFSSKRISSEYTPLSGGQLKRLGLARALHVSKDILVLDEPTSGLDIASESTVVASLSRLRSCYKLIIIISHSNTFNLLADYSYDLSSFSSH